MLQNSTNAWLAERNGELHLAMSYCEVLSQGYDKDASFEEWMQNWTLNYEDGAEGRQ